MFSTISPLFDSQDHHLQMLHFTQLYEILPVDVSPSYFEESDYTLVPLVIDHATPYYS
jgi:hypothetical protein